MEPWQTPFAEGRECSLTGRRRRGCDGRGWRLGALDDEPQHERYLREEGGLGEEKQLVLVLRQQFAGKAEEHIGEAVDGEPDAQEEGQEARPVREDIQMEKPKTRQNLGNSVV